MSHDFRHRSRVLRRAIVRLGGVFVAGVLVGADSMSRGVAVPTYIAEVIVAISLLSMLTATAFARFLWT